MSVPVDFAPAGTGDMKPSIRPEGRGRRTADDGAFTRIVRQMNRLMAEVDAKAGRAGTGDEAAQAGWTADDSRATRHPMGRHDARNSFAHALFARSDWNRPPTEATAKDEAEVPAEDVDATVAAVEIDGQEAHAADTDGDGDIAGAMAVAATASAAPEATTNTPPAAEAEADSVGDGDALAATEAAADEKSTPAPRVDVRANDIATGDGDGPASLSVDQAAEGVASVPAAPASDAEIADRMAEANLRVTARETHMPPGQAAAAPQTMAPRVDGETSEGVSADGQDNAAETPELTQAATDTPDRDGEGEASAGDRHAAPREPQRAAPADRATAQPPAATNGTTAASAATPQPVSPAAAGLPNLASALSQSLKGDAPAAPGVTAVAPPDVTLAPGPVRSVSVTLDTAEHGVLDVRMRLGDGGLDVHLRAERADTVERLRHDQAALAGLLRDHGYETAVVRVEARHATASADGGARADGQSAAGQMGGGAADLAGGGRQAPAEDRQPHLPEGATPFAIDEPMGASHEASAAPRGTSGLYL